MSSLRRRRAHYTHIRTHTSAHVRKLYVKIQMSDIELALLHLVTHSFIKVDSVLNQMSGE